MRKSLKIVTLAAVLSIALGAVALAYASAQNNGSANNDEQQTYTTNMYRNMETYLAENNATAPFHMRRPQLGVGEQSFGRFLQNATLSSVEGSVVTVTSGMLVLNTGSTEVRVLLPKEWTLGNEVVSRAALFNGTFASAGQTVTVDVLKSTVFSGTGFSVNIMLGYEAINATGTHAYAVLPFNIQANP